MQEKIKKLLCEAKNDESIYDSINESTSIINDLGLDSLQMINFVLLIEDEFGIELDFDNFDYSYLNSVKSLCDFIAGCPKAQIA